MSIKTPKIRINSEDYFYAFFAGIASLVFGVLLVFLVAPNYFGSDPSIPVISLVVILEIVVFFVVFVFMRNRYR